MADMFSMFDAKNLLRNKKVYMFGDSNMRAFYKDLVCLIQKGTLIDDASLRKKLESQFLKDKLLKQSPLTAGRDYVEQRLYNVENIFVKYSFITRCWCDAIKSFIQDCSKNIIKPDVVIINSCIWDVTRWGPNGVDEYKINMKKLFEEFNKSLPNHCIVIWSTTLPVAPKCKAAVLIEQIDFLKHSLPFDVMEANTLAKDIVLSHGYDILDLYHFLRMQCLLQKSDGIHWQAPAVRFVINLFLTHIALSWSQTLPGRIYNVALENILQKRVIRKIEQPANNKENIKQNLNKVKKNSNFKKKKNNKKKLQRNHNKVLNNNNNTQSGTNNPINNFNNGPHINHALSSSSRCPFQNTDLFNGQRAKRARFF